MNQLAKNLIVTASLCACSPTALSSELPDTRSISCDNPKDSLTFLERYFSSTFRKKIDAAILRCIEESEVAREYLTSDINYRESTLDDKQYRLEAPAPRNISDATEFRGSLSYNNIVFENKNDTTSIDTAEGFSTKSATD